MSGAVRNADRIWARTPQNRTYQGWNSNRNYLIYFLIFMRSAMWAENDPFLAKVLIERTAFFIAFQGFDGVRSTQPTMP